MSGSAIGYYGDHGDEVIDETTGPGDDFPARVCIEWEASAQAAVEAGIRVAFLRTGIVQSTEGGALAKQLPFFRLCLGGKAGSGRQYVSWISIEDEVRAICHLIDADVAGPVNLVAPEPVTNAEYTKVLFRVLRRPMTFLPMAGPRLLYGRELADSLLLTSQRSRARRRTCSPTIAGFTCSPDPSRSSREAGALQGRVARPDPSGWSACGRHATTPNRGPHERRPDASLPPG